MSNVTLNIEALDRIAAALEKMADMTTQLDITLSELAANTYPSVRAGQPIMTALTAATPTIETPTVLVVETKEPVAETPVVPNVTVEDIMRTVPEIRKQGKLQQVVALFPEYGIEKLSQLKPDQAGAFAAKLKDIGIEVTEG